MPPAAQSGARVARVRAPAPLATRPPGRPETAAGSEGTFARKAAASEASSRSVRDEDVAQAPDRLNEARLGRIRFDQLAQPRDLHVQAAIERLVLAAAGHLHQLLARQRNLRKACEHL